MSSCSSCGSCTKYFPTPSGKCDYCDCPHADHVSQAQSGMNAMGPVQGQEFNPMMTQQASVIQRTMSQPMGYTQQPYQMQPPFYQQHSMPMTQPYMQPNPYNAPFAQPNQFQPYGGMPMMPPNQLSQPYFGNTACTMCGIILPPESKEKMCMTCRERLPASPCTKCKVNKANPGFSWCQACFESDDKCRKCGKNEPNQGYKWCESCFRSQDNPADCFPDDEEQVLQPKERCPCGKGKLLDIKRRKYFDFCGQTCAQQHYTAYGVLRVENSHEDFIHIASQFKNNWNAAKGAVPPVTAIFKVRPNGIEAKFDNYQKHLNITVRTLEYYFHGCKLTCDLLNTNKLCNRADCTICLVSRQGFDISKVGTNVKFTRFGRGLYFAPESSKCHDYTLGIPQYGYRAMFYVRCAPGFKQLQFTDNTNRTAPDQGYNSLYGHAGGSLNYDELCLYTDQACLPEYIIVYNRDGVDRRCH